MLNNCGVYIHIPFCISKCDYCDFLSFAEVLPQEDYVNALVNEISKARFVTGVGTVYIGGGTPTMLPTVLLQKVLESVKKLPLVKDAEFTVEANPGTLDREKLELLKSYGVNRLSIGLQSTSNNLLGALGRSHTVECFMANYHQARNLGFQNINIDLMFALPGQNLQMWQDSLDTVIALEPEHISAYSLTPAPKTPLWEQLESGALVLPDDESDREMYHYAGRALASAGYEHYEISNFAKPGFESRHNVDCWKMKPYFGFGLGAHSFDGKVRWQNPEHFADYTKTATMSDKSQLRVGGEDLIQKTRQEVKLTEEDLLTESMILGLRLLGGMRDEEIVPGCTVPSVEYFKTQIDVLVNRGLMERNGKTVKLTALGLDFANRVFAEFIVQM